MPKQEAANNSFNGRPVAAASASAAVNSTVSRHNLPHMASLSSLLVEVRACRLCADICRSATPCCPGSSQRSHPHCSQAPGRRVTRQAFIQRPKRRQMAQLMGSRTRSSTIPNASQSSYGFCFPGTASRAICRPFRVCPSVARGHSVTSEDLQLTLVIGQYAQAYHLPSETQSVTAVVQAWRETVPRIALPIPATQ